MKGLKGNKPYKHFIITRKRFIKPNGCLEITVNKMHTSVKDKLFQQLLHFAIMSDTEELASEEFDVDFNQASNAWYDGLSNNNGVDFLEKLRQLMGNEPKFSRDKVQISKIITWLGVNSVENPSQFAKSRIQKFKNAFNLTDVQIHALDYLAIQVVSNSPKMYQFDKELNKRRFSNSKSSTINSNTSDDYYEDDFEAADENSELQLHDEEYEYEILDEPIANNDKDKHKKLSNAQMYHRKLSTVDEEDEDIRTPNHSSQRAATVTNTNTHTNTHTNTVLTLEMDEEELQDYDLDDVKDYNENIDPYDHKHSHSRKQEGGIKHATHNLLPKSKFPVTTTVAKSADIMAQRNVAPVVNVNAASVSVTASTNSTRSSSNRSRTRQPGWIDRGEFRLGENIGKGSFGEVFQCLCTTTGKIYAVKRLFMVGKQEEIKNLIGEIDLMRRLNHVNIVQYFGSKIDEENGIVFIFLEWVPGICLFELDCIELYREDIC